MILASNDAMLEVNSMNISTYRLNFPTLTLWAYFNQIN